MTKKIYECSQLAERQCKNKHLDSPEARKWLREAAEVIQNSEEFKKLVRDFAVFGKIKVVINVPEMIFSPPEKNRNG